MGGLINMDSFAPQENIKNCRSAFSRFATGIAVVTALDENGPAAITINSFANVSLVPALILWNPDKNSARHDLFVSAEYFVVHVVAAHQRAICDAFVKSAHAFGQVETCENEFGVPLIEDCLAIFECRKFEAIDAGDHTILLGEALKARHRSGEALVFADGAFSKMPAA